MTPENALPTFSFDQFDAELEAYAASSQPFLQSLLVMHAGRIVFERYWRGYACTSYQPVFSVTKSVVSALVGLAIADGRLSFDDTLALWFPELALTAADHASRVTIRHLLTMTAGFERPAGRSNASDPLTALLRRKGAFLPGKKFQYSNEDVDLLAAVLERAVGEPAGDYAARRLFAPLGIWQDVAKSSRRRLWKTDRQGRTKGGHGLHLTTRELATFGQFYLQAGRWQDESVLPADYAAASTSAQVSGGYPESVKYGYLWWISTDSAGRHAFFASGRSGQYVYVVPELELVITITAMSQNASGRHHRVMVVSLVTRALEAILQAADTDPHSSQG